MPPPSAYTDEDVPLAAARGLRVRGYSIVTSLEAGALGSTDDAQLMRATGLGRLILTHNRRHFQRLHAEFARRGQPHGGIALLPQDTEIARLVVRAAIMLTWIGEGGDHRSKLYQWNECQQALIHGYRPAGFGDDETRLALGR